MKKLNIYLIAIVLVALQSYLIRFQIGGYPTNLLEILIGLSAIVFIINSVVKKTLLQHVRNLRFHWIILGFIFLTLISVLMAPTEQTVDFIRHLKFLFFAVIFSLIFLESLPEDKNRKTIIRIAGYGALAFGLFSLIYNLLGYNVAHDLRLTGPLDAAVYLAYYLTPFFLFFAMEYFQNQKAKNNLIMAILLGILILATKSMGAIGASFLILTFFIYKKSDFKFLKTTAGKLLIGLIGVIIIGGIFYTKILPTLQTEYSSLTERGEIWQTSLHLLKNPKTVIFGLGFGQFEYNYINEVYGVLGHPPLDYYVIQPHNIFLLFIFHYGILGLLFITFIIGLTLRRIFQFTKTKEKELDITTLATFILLYFFTHGLIDTPIFKNDILILFILFLEMALSKKSLT